MDPKTVILKLAATVVAIGAFVAAQFISDQTAKQALVGVGGTILGWAWFPSPGQSGAPKVPPAVTGILAVLFVVGAGALPGCALFRSGLADVQQWAQTADRYEKDAQVRLDQLHAVVEAAVAVMPDLPADARKAIEQAFADADGALAAAIAATANVESLADEATLANVFAGFADAWTTIQTILSTFGVLASPKVAAAAPVPAPLVCRLVAQHRAAVVAR